METVQSPSSSVSSLAGPQPQAHHPSPSSVSSASDFSSGMVSSDQGGRSLSPATASLSSGSSAASPVSAPPPPANVVPLDALHQPQGRIKRALAARRKKRNGDSISSAAAFDATTSGDELSSSSLTGLSVAQRAARWGGQVRANTGPSLGKLQTATLQVFGRKKTPTPMSPTPPAPPPKPDRLRSATVGAMPLDTSDLGVGQQHARASFVPSPSISAALQYMNDADEREARERPAPVTEEPELQDERRDEVTPTNSALRRPAGTGTSSADSRRVSVAATIRPVSGAPSVATITAANAAPFENDEDPPPDQAAHMTVPRSDSDDASASSPARGDSQQQQASARAGVPGTPDRARPSPGVGGSGAHPQHGATGNLSKAQKRRSMSLDLTPAKSHWVPVQPAPYSSALDVAHLQRVPPSPPATPPSLIGSTSSLGSQSHAYSANSLSREDVRGIIGHAHSSSRSSASSTAQSTSGAAGAAAPVTLRERLTALGLAQENPRSPPPQHPRRGQMLSQPSPPPQRTAPSSYANGLQPPPTRRTAVSMTQSLQQSLAPAAAAASGIALGFGKKAYDKVEKLWGGTNNAGAHASSTSLASSSGASRNGGLRRTPNAPSGAWSVASMAMSVSSSDEGSTYSAGAQVMSASLGPCLRLPRSSGGSSYGAAASGLVFGRNLAECVRDTRVARVVNVTASSPKPPPTPAPGPARNIEDRALPALIVRCVQHLRRWGVEEEGLFRISGRASHIAKLRAEFDTGADYDLKEASPGQLDPHAVASVFKAYLRELPEPLLTRTLSPMFDDVVVSTPNSHAQQMQEFYGLPSGPRTVPQMRKPPSLSNLGPNASPLLLHKLSTLISRLPAENRDLLFTVIDLLKTTAANAKSTKMPLANLLLLFCPSLQVSPTLLRLLCEAESIWHGPLPAPIVSSTASSSHGHGSVPEEDASSDRMSGESVRAAVPRERVVSGMPLGALSGGPRPRAGAGKRSHVPGISPGQISDVFSAALLQASSSTSPPPRTPSIYLDPSADDKPLPQSPHTPGSRLSDAMGSLSPRRFSSLGPGNSPSASSSQVSTPQSVRSQEDLQSPPSPSSLRGLKRNAIRPSLQLMFSNKRSTSDLSKAASASPMSSTSSPMQSGTPQSSTLTLPPVLSLATVSPGFSSSLESFMSEDARSASPSPAPLPAARASTDYLGSTLSLAISNSGSGASSRSTSSLVIPVSEEARKISSMRRSPSPRPPPITTPTPASSDETPVQTPIADMFRSPSRAGLLDDEEQVVLLPPLSFSQSPMYPGSSRATPLVAPSPALDPRTPPPRLDIKLSREQETDDDDDWAHIVLSAADDSPRGPLRIRDAGP